jgi:hypothetical protein
MSTATELLAEYDKAIMAVLKAQSYTIGNRSVTKADLRWLEDGRTKYKKEVADEARGGIPVQGITCVDN